MTQSSELAGGDGFTFEGHVGALYLTALLAKQSTVGCDGIVINVATQQRDFNNPLDDIVVSWLDNSNRHGTTSIQVKRHLTISDAKTNTDFRDIIRDSWKTFTDQHFIKNLDKFGVAVGYIATSKLRALRFLCEIAKESNDIKHFNQRFSKNGNASSEVKSIKNTIQNIILDEINISPSDEQLRSFLAHFIVIQFDFLHEGAISNQIAYALLREFLGVDRSDQVQLVWGTLNNIIRISAGKSGQYDHERLVNDLKKVISINPDKLVGTKTKFLEDASNYIQNKFTKIPILGSRSPISLNSCWIPLKATIVESESYNPTNLEIALKNYHDFHQLKKRDQITIDASTFGRFVKKAVILGGPGIGKSTLLKKLALDYSAEGKLVIFVKLSTLLTYLEDKALTFEESILRCAFENSLNLNDSSIFENAIILGDGLDECGKYQKNITNAFHLFSQKYPTSRILLSSRPIGYISGLLGDWRHYQLQPIEEHMIHEAVTKIIKALPNSDAHLLEDKVNLVRHQINSKYVKGLASRSPLILTLMCVLVSQSTEIATNRASLYRQFFNILQKNSTDREIATHPDSDIRLKFLYALGSILYSKDSPLFDEINNELEKILKAQLGGSILEIKKIINDCISYWEEMGVIEQVQTLTESTITFIHKTFCEFSFAKYIESCNFDTQKQIFSHFYSDSNFIEVISFLSHLGLSNRILEFLRYLSMEDKRLQLSKYLKVIIDSTVDWNSKNVDEFIELCWQETKNTFSTHRYNAGSALCLASSHCWEKMRATIETYHQSGDNWVKSVTWVCLLSRSDYLISNEELLESLEFFQLNFPERNQLNDGLSIVLDDSLYAVRDLFLSAITERILSNHKQYPETTDTLSSYLLKIMGSLSLNLNQKLNSIYDKFNLKIANNKVSPWDNNNYISSRLNDFDECFINFYSILTFGTEEESFSPLGRDENLIELGAFITLIELNECVLSSFFVFQDPIKSDQDLRMILFKNLAKIARLDYEKLQKQAKYKLLQILNSSTNTSRLEDIPSVDITIDYDLFDLDKDILKIIKIALLSGNEILCRIAINIGLGFINTKEFNDMVCELIQQGQEDDLAYSAFLGKKIPHDIFQTELLEKLNSSNLTHGCNYLFRYLDPFYNKKLYLDSLYNGLSSSDPDVAKAAIESLPYDFLNKQVVTELRKYYEEWKDKEKPYPKGSGTVPTTPRDKLADFLLTYNSEDISLLKQMALDSRPDIRKLSVQPLIDLARENFELKKWIVTEVCNGNLKRSFLKEAIQHKIYLNNYDIILPLLLHDDSKIRFIASSILKYESISESLIREQAKLLLNDPIIEIREIAHNILNT